MSCLQSEEKRTEDDHSFHTTDSHIPLISEISVDWFADSGATRHMSGNYNLFTNLKDKESTILNIKGIGGKRLRVKGVGDVFFETVMNGKTQTGVFKAVLYIPNLGVNLVSI